jgi:hypothetical protein
MDTVIVALPACAAGCCAGVCQDPQYQFELWARAHGYTDIFDDEPSRVSLARLDEAVTAYAAGETRTAADALAAARLALGEQETK